MAKNSSKNSSSRRRSPMVSKAGVTREPKRRYGCGGKIKK